MSLGLRKRALWMLLLALIWAYNLESCIQEERNALVYLTSYFKSHGGSGREEEAGREEENEDNCCTWQWVRCNSISQRVVMLDLSAQEFNRNSPWVFNATMLQPFGELTTLDLSMNNIGGLIERGGSTRLTTLRNLKSLRLDRNRFEKGLISLSELTSLEILSASFCGLNDSAFLQDLANLKQLRVLDLSFNDFSATIEGLTNLTKLQILHLEHNNIHGSIQGLCEMKSIMKLNLQGNDFDGTLPLCLCNLFSLETLDLSNNNLEEKFSLSVFANLSKLQHLDLSGNQLEVHTEDSLWQPSFQLQFLNLQDCRLNNPIGTTPQFLLQQYNMSYINLSENGLHGAFPAWLLYNNSKVQALMLDNNNFMGYFMLRSNGTWYLEFLMISTNHLQGEFPSNIGLMLPQLYYLNASNNHFEGSIPTSIAHMGQLEFLDLSRNNFSGTVPGQIFINCTFLMSLQLNDNKLQGDIIPKHTNLRELSCLDLSGNHFDGTLKLDALLSSTQSSWFQKSTPLMYLDLSNNNITGELPRFIGNFSSLRVMSLSNNNLQGQIPRDLCKLNLEVLDLSRNNFTAPIPPCLSCSSLQYIHLHNNGFTGPIPNVLSKCSRLITLDLRNNKLSEIIPPWIDKLVSLQVLLLAENNLQGPIPHELCRLLDIDILDLSHNRFSGPILGCLANLSFGVRSISNDSAGQLMEGNEYWKLYSSPDEVPLLVKNIQVSYVNVDLLLMSAMDLSSNNLSGFIPPELGNLKHIQTLNFSHNSLSGYIPTSFSNLKRIESLDLSYNNLSGMIPAELTDLNFLEIFNVSFNNLTGRTPETGQFGHFDESCYLGNPMLCISLLNKSCKLVPQNPLPPTKVDGDGRRFYKDDFLWSFGVTSFMAFVAVILVLSINSQWREAFFDFVALRLHLWWL